MPHRRRSRCALWVNAAARQKRSWNTIFGKRAIKDDQRDDEAAKHKDVGVVDNRDVAAIQNDDRLTAADRVDLIANQVVTKGEDGSEPDNRP